MQRKKKNGGKNDNVIKVKTLASMKSLFSEMFYFINYGNSLLTEIILIYVALSSPNTDYPIFGVVLIIGRFFHIYPTFIICASIADDDDDDDKKVNMSIEDGNVEIENKNDDNNNNPKKSNSENWEGSWKLKKYLGVEHFFDNTLIYTGLLLISCLDCQLLKHLPWLTSPFSNKLGFPNYNLTSLVYKIRGVNLLFMWIAQIGFLTLNGSNNNNDKFQ